MRSAVIALGFFDGVHRGHQSILQRAAQYGRENGLTPCALTFLNQPRAFLKALPQELIISKESRETRIKACGIENVYMIPFDKATANMAPEAFVKEILIDRYDCAAAVCGENFTFGAMGKGNGELLKSLGGQFGFETIVCPLLPDGDDTVSSSRVRRMLTEGRVEEASRLLGYDYYIKGEVVHGRGVGTKMGVPTCNIALGPDLMTPKKGVYASRTEIDGAEYLCALNIGQRPTFNLHETVAEFNVLDFNGDLYGRELKIFLLGYIRPERAFSSPEELKEQIDRDIVRIKEMAP